MYVMTRFSYFSSRWSPPRPFYFCIKEYNHQRAPSFSLKRPLQNDDCMVTPEDNQNFKTTSARRDSHKDGSFVEVSIRTKS